MRIREYVCPLATIEYVKPLIIRMSQHLDFLWIVAGECFLGIEDPCAQFSLARSVSLGEYSQLLRVANLRISEAEGEISKRGEEGVKALSAVKIRDTLRKAKASIKSSRSEDTNLEIILRVFRENDPEVIPLLRAIIERKALTYVSVNCALPN